MLKQRESCSIWIDILFFAKRRGKEYAYEKLDIDSYVSWSHLSSQMHLCNDECLDLCSVIGWPKRGSFNLLIPSDSFWKLIMIQALWTTFIGSTFVKFCLYLNGLQSRCSTDASRSGENSVSYSVLLHLFVALHEITLFTAFFMDCRLVWSLGSIAYWHQDLDSFPQRHLHTIQAVLYENILPSECGSRLYAYALMESTHICMLPSVPVPPVWITPILLSCHPYDS